MTTSKSQAEVRAEYIARMGPELGDLQYLLMHEVTWLHLKWQEFREIFGTSATRIHLMNQTAPAFFGRLQDVLWHDVLLHLTRLTDPPVMRGHQNLTFGRYVPLVADLPIRGEMHAALDRVEAGTRFARDWRNRLLAHRDYPHAQDPAAKPLEPGSRADVEDALAAIRDLMQIPEHHFLGSATSYERTQGAPGGACDLLYWLESGLEAQRSDDP